MENKLKSYEISLWKDVYDEDSGFYKEKKIMVIGSNTMKTSNRAFSPVLKQSLNGETTLEFSILYKVYNEYINKKIINPFIPYLVNERKIKLKYGDEWFDFILKTKEESSENTFTYTAVDANILELSKNGYGIVFSTELKNNQGTVVELGKEAIKGSNWEIDEDGSDKIKTYLDEPVYKGELTKSIWFYNMEDSSEVKFNEGQIVYLFYSQIKNKKPKDLQVVKADENFIFDDNGVAKGTNYRYAGTVTYSGNFPKFVKNVTLFTDYQVKRLVRNQKALYDKVTEKVVDVYTTPKNRYEIYHYKESAYTTPDILVNYIANGSNFKLNIDSGLNGWEICSEDLDNNSLGIKTIPSFDEIGNDVSQILDVRNYLEMTINANNYIYNCGIQSNRSLIKDFVQGEEYSFKIRAGALPNKKIINTKPNLKIIIAPYNFSNNGIKIPDLNCKIMEFNLASAYQENVEVSDGSFSEPFEQGGKTGYRKYEINGVVQTPDPMKYYIEKGQSPVSTNNYKWDANVNGYVKKENTDLNFYRVEAKCLRSVPDLNNADKEIGIFFYSEGAKRQYYIESIQFFKTIIVDGKKMMIGNAPQAKTIYIDYFYLAPKEDAKKTDLDFYSTLKEIALSLHLSEEDIVPKFDEDCQMVSMIEAEKTNHFDILQQLCEKFECWMKFEIEREEIYIKTEDLKIYFEKDYYELSEGKYVKVKNPVEEDLENYYEKITTGAPKINEDTGRPIKKIAFKKYIGKDNYAGFKYGVNLTKIDRTVNSEEIVTKLIVPQSENQNVEGGLVTIQAAQSNPSGLNYILNFNYFVKQGLLDSGLNNLVSFYQEIKDKNDEILSKQKEKAQVDLSITKLEAQSNVFSSLLEAAKKDKQEYKEDFHKIAKNFTYDDYVSNHTLIDKNNSSLLEYIAKIKICDYYLNTYGSSTQDWKRVLKEQKIKSNGYPIHTLEIIKKADGDYVWTLDDYIEGFTFKIYGSETVQEYTTNFYTKSGDFSFNPVSIEIIKLPEGYVEPSSRRIFIYDLPFTINLEPANTDIGFKNDIKKLLKEKEEIEQNYLNKFGPFIQEGTWNSNEYVDNELYYLDAVKSSYNSGKPQVEYSIDVIEISGLEEFKNYEFKIGDKTYIEDTDFFGYININSVPTPVKEEVVISEVTHHLDSPEEDSITVKNYKTEFEDLFQRLAATTQSIQYKEGSYARAASAIDASGIINPDVLLNSFGAIGSQGWNLTNNGIIHITDDGIVATDPREADRKLKLGAGVLRGTVDGGATWTDIITPDSINIELLSAGIINTRELLIMNEEAPAFRWDKDGINAFAYLPKEKQPSEYEYKQNTFVRLDRFGVYGIKKKEFDDRPEDVSPEKISEYEYFVPTNIDEIEDNARFGLTWNGFFLNSDHGAVKISSKDDIQVFNGDNKVKIHIGRIATEPEEKYGIRINDNNENLVLETDDDGDLALAGLLSSISYKENPSTGWAVNGEGNAIFNNITARGAIKTAVFEYAEIQAVGGVFLFRPSSRIKTARIGNSEKGEDLNDIIVTVDKPELFKTGAWCKVSNYYTGEEPPESITKNNGLLYIYPINVAKVPDPEDPEKEITEITLTGAAKMMKGEKPPIESEVELIGGALVDMGDIDKNSNYGIGINSSDNSVALPPRSISLFETTINPNPDSDIKVTYDYKGVLGTLPSLGDKVNSLYETNMIGTQGLYTDNLYLGNKDQYIMFYEYKENEETKKTLRIKSEHFTLENSSPSMDNYLFLSDETYEEVKGAGSEFSVAGSTKRGDWRQVIGNNFGVTQNGTLFASNGTFNGRIEAESGYLSNNIEIGEKDKFHITLSGNQIAFWSGPEGELDIKGQPVNKKAYINKDYMYIPYTVVLNEMRVGQGEEQQADNAKWSWRYIPNTQNLRLVWIGGEGE